jgi:hypothetical protein
MYFMHKSIGSIFYVERFLITTFYEIVTYIRNNSFRLQLETVFFYEGTVAPD